MSLRDWLDAGYVMLIEGADATARGLLDDLFSAATDEDMDAAFAELRAEMDFRVARSDEIEREHRERTGGPLHVRRVSDDAIENVLNEWAEIRESGLAEPE